MLSVLLLAGCGEKAAGEQLIMATNATFPPYEYYDGDKIVGIDIDIGEALAEKLGRTLVVEDMEFNSIVSAVSTGKADIGMAALSVTDKRKESVDFSINYAKGVQVIIVKQDSDITGPDDLEGKTIGVQIATTGDIYASDDFGEENIERFNKGTDTVLALAQGKVDAVIVDSEPAKVFVQQNPDLKLLDTAYADEDYALIVKKDQADFLAEINQALQELIDDGTLQKIVDKYIVAE